MSRLALIFLLAIFVPALLLGGLALRTAGKQRVILEQQEAELQQKETDSLAAEVRQALNVEHQSFAEGVNRLLAEVGPETLARTFPSRLGEVWARAGVGFAVTTGGAILSPKDELQTGAPQSPSAETIRQFLEENRAFLGNLVEVEVYQSSPEVASKLGAAQQAVEGRQWDRLASSSNPESQSAPPPTASRKMQQDHLVRQAELEDGTEQGKNSEADQVDAVFAMPTEEAETSSDSRARERAPDESNESRFGKFVRQRKVAPQKVEMQTVEAPMSRLNVETSRFAPIVEGQTSGIISRFVQDELEILFWVRPPAAQDIVFGVQLDTADLRPLLAPLVTEKRGDAGVCLAILDDHARPFAKSLPAFVTNWKTPFVATEIGEVLPHWEVVLYLTDPGRLARSARLVQLSLVGVIALALGAIGFGSYLIAADTRRQLSLARKKTDFVSNVSHELKTPLTSIRLFAELLHEDRISDDAKRRKYLRIITLESERLTRLINNVLDFSKLERKQKRYQKRLLDLHAVIRQAWEPVEMHLQDAGFETKWEAGPPPYRVLGDEDALAQVVVNLLSNAEKYSTETRCVELHSDVNNGWVCVSVLDSGVGVPRGEERKIFEQFYRAHDSLSSGIQGSGLGLTLAMRIAKDHGGTITFERRKGGGSAFTLRLPIANKS